MRKEYAHRLGGAEGNFRLIAFNSIYISSRNRRGKEMRFISHGATAAVSSSFHLDVLSEITRGSRRATVCPRQIAYIETINNVISPLHFSPRRRAANLLFHPAFSLSLSLSHRLFSQFLLSRPRPSVLAKQILRGVRRGTAKEVPRDS